MPFSPPPGEIAATIRSRFQPYLDEHVHPRKGRPNEERELTPDALRAAGKVGLFGYSLPEAVGGEGNDPFAWGIMLEQLALLCRDYALPLVVATHALTTAALARLERAPLVERWVRPSIAGERIGGWSYAPDLVSTHGTLKVREEEGGVLMLSGRQPAVAPGLLADWFLVYAHRSSGDLVLVLVERSDPGVMLHLEAPAPVRSTETIILELHGVKIPADRVLLPSGAEEHAAVLLQRHYAAVLCVTLGRMQVAVHECVLHLRKTHRDNEPLSDDLSVRATLGKLYAALEASRTVTYRALDRLRWTGADPRWDPQVSLARGFVADQAAVINQGIAQLLGVTGYVEGFLERYLRDALVLIPNTGAQDALYQRLGAQLVRDQHAHRAELETAARDPKAKERMLSLAPWWKRLLLKASRRPTS